MRRQDTRDVEKRQAQAPDWRQTAAARLADILTHRDLGDLLGDLLNSARATLRQRKGHDTSGSKLDLARALLLVHHEDVLAYQPARELVARRGGVDPPGRWHPGKASALEFVRACDLPLALAGIPAGERGLDIEYLDSPPALPPLADFQEEVASTLLLQIRTPGGRAILSLPTGAGKTRTAVETVHRLLTRPGVDERPRPYAVIWLAHTEELCEQALQSFRQVFLGLRDGPPAVLVRFWGGYTQGLDRHREALGQIDHDFTVLISTPQRLMNTLDTDDPHIRPLADDLVARTGIVVLDEAHRAAAPTYRRIIDRFATSPLASVVGLTATPFRQEYIDRYEGTRELKLLFRRLVEAQRTLGERPIDVLQSRGILARPEIREIHTRQLVKVQGSLFEGVDDARTDEQIDDELNTQVDRATRRREILKAILTEVLGMPDLRMVYFGPSVHDAECMAFLLQDAGVLASVVSAKTRSVTRRRVVQEFRAGRIRCATARCSPRVSTIRV
jgi:DNA repair protein RadD